MTEVRGERVRSKGGNREQESKTVVGRYRKKKKEKSSCK
jgi:hypothetical protein